VTQLVLYTDLVNEGVTTGAMNEKRKSIAFGNPYSCFRFFVGVAYVVSLDFTSVVFSFWFLILYQSF